jgi:hypothetical protein
LKLAKLTILCLKLDQYSHILNTKNAYRLSDNLNLTFFFNQFTPLSISTQIRNAKLIKAHFDNSEGVEQIITYPIFTHLPAKNDTAASVVAETAVLFYTMYYQTIKQAWTCRRQQLSL